MSDKKTKKTPKAKNLSYLHELSDYTVSDDDKDVRGWPVKDANGNLIGEIDNLLVSKANNRVVYLEVEIDKSIVDENHAPYSVTADDGNTTKMKNKKGENHVIIPIGMAHLDLDKETVRTPKISRDIFARTKRIKKGSTINRHYETNILESYGRGIDTNFTDKEKETRDTTLYDRSEYSKEAQSSKGIF